MLFTPRRESNSGLDPDPNSPYLIRSARIADREAIGDLWVELMTFHQERDARFEIAPDARYKYIRHTQEMIRARDCRVVVAEEKKTGRVVGYVIAEIKLRTPITTPGLYGALADLYVSPAHRRHALGRRLVDEIFHWMREKKCVAVQLYVAEQNPEGQKFWEAMGMTPYLKLLHQDL